MNHQKPLLLTGLLLLAGLAIPGAGAGVIQLNSGAYTVLDWKSSSTQGSLDSSSVYISDALNYISYNGSDYYTAGRGNTCGFVFCLKAADGEYLRTVTVDVSSYLATWTAASYPTAQIYGTYKAGTAATLAPGQSGTQYIWNFYGDTSLFSHNPSASTGSYEDSITLDFTGLGYSYVYLSFFMTNADSYDWQAFKVFDSATDGSNPGLTISVVPEPASLGLLALGGLALLRRRRN